MGPKVHRTRARASCSPGDGKKGDLRNITVPFVHGPTLGAEVPLNQATRCQRNRGSSKGRLARYRHPPPVGGGSLSVSSDQATTSLEVAHGCGPPIRTSDSAGR